MQNWSNLRVAKEAKHRFKVFVVLSWWKLNRLVKENHLSARQLINWKLIVIVWVKTKALSVHQKKVAILEASIVVKTYLSESLKKKIFSETNIIQIILKRNNLKQKTWNRVTLKLLGNSNIHRVNWRFKYMLQIGSSIMAKWMARKEVSK